MKRSLVFLIAALGSSLALPLAEPSLAQPPEDGTGAGAGLTPPPIDEPKDGAAIPPQSEPEPPPLPEPPPESSSPHPKTRCPARHLRTRRRKARASTRIELSLDAKRRTSLKYRTGDRRVGGYRDTGRSHPLLSLRTWRRNLPVHERGKPGGESCLLPARCRGALEPTVLASQLRRNLWRSRSIHWRARFDADSDHTDGECTWVRFVLGDRRRCRPLRPVPRLWWRRRRETKLCASPAISCE
jgi:hypothetical protein